MELVDVPVLCNKSTWFKLDGKEMSHLDRFLLFGEMIVKCKVEGQGAGNKDLSDHCSIWIRGNGSN